MPKKAVTTDTQIMRRAKIAQLQGSIDELVKEAELLLSKEGGQGADELSPEHVDSDPKKLSTLVDCISEVLHSEIRQKDSARGSEVENAHEDSECLFGKSSLCRKYFSDAFSCRRALARDLFKEVSYLGIAWQASLAT